MPIYDYECKICGITENIWAKINEEIINCPHCGEPAWRIISVCNINPDLKPRWEDNIAHPEKAPHGSWIKSRQHRDKLCKEYGLNITK
jgi:putative FmdB family regulatory protein